MHTSYLTEPIATAATLMQNGSRTIGEESSCGINPSFWNIIYAFFMCVLLLSSVAGNSLVIFAVVMSNKLTERSPTFHFVASLACSDMVMAMSQIPFHISLILHNYNFCHGLYACYLRQVMSYVGNIASILNLFIISIDRFVAVLYPYKYRTILSHGRAKQIIMVLWSCALSLGVSGIIRWDYTLSGKPLLSIQVSKICINDNYGFLLTILCVFYVPLLAIMSCINLQILFVTIRQIRQIHKSTPTPQQTLDCPRSNGKTKRISPGTFFKELKATKTLGVVYLAFCICWLPGTIIAIILFFDEARLRGMKKRHYRFIWFMFVDILPMVNTMIDPVIYSFTNTQFRKALIDVWCKLMGKSRRRDSVRASTEGTELISVNNL